MLKRVCLQGWGRFAPHKCSNIVRKKKKKKTTTHNKQNKNWNSKKKKKKKKKKTTYPELYDSLSMSNF